MSVGHESIDASNYRALRFKRQGDVLIITIDHPSNKLNAVDDVLHTELTRLFADLKRESRARAAVITGAGRMFSAGGDFEHVGKHVVARVVVDRLDAVRRHKKK